MDSQGQSYSWVMDSLKVSLTHESWTAKVSLTHESWTAKVSLTHECYIIEERKLCSDRSLKGDVSIQLQRCDINWHTLCVQQQWHALCAVIVTCFVCSDILCVQWHALCAVTVTCFVCSDSDMLCVQWQWHALCAVTCSVCSDSDMVCVQWHALCAVTVTCSVCSDMLCVQWQWHGLCAYISTPCLNWNDTNSNAYISYMDYKIFLIFYSHVLGWCKNMCAKFQAIW